MVAKLLSFQLLALLLPISAWAGLHDNPLLNRHRGLAKRVNGTVELEERDTEGGRTTWYIPDGNLGSCGTPIANSDYAVALNGEEMNASHCFQKIIITYGGKSITATILDTCPGCPKGGLDLTEGLFQKFASLDKGVIYTNWRFSNNRDSSRAAASPARKITTSTHHTTTTHHSTTTSHHITPTPLKFSNSSASSLSTRLLTSSTSESSTQSSSVPTATESA